MNAAVLWFLRKYKPFLDLSKWSMATIAGLRYLKDFGTSKSVVSLFYGRGILLDSGQSITLPINYQVQTVCYMLDGVLYFDEATVQMGDYVIDTLGLHQNYIFYDGIFTATQKEKLENNPEEFLWWEKQTIDDVSTWIPKSKHLSDEELANVVSNPLLLDRDEYIRVMGAYSETNISGSVDAAPTWDDEIGTYTKHSDTSFDLAVTTAGTNNTRPYLAHSFTCNSSTVYHKVSFDLIVNSGVAHLDKIYNGSFLPIGTLNSGRFERILLRGDDSYGYLVMYFSGETEFDISVTNFKVESFSGFIPIAGYTESCNEDNKQTSYQTNHVVMDESNSIPIAEGFDRLNYDGVGYADTGWIPRGDYKLEVIFKVKHLGIHQQNGVYSGSGSGLFYGLWTDDGLIINLGNTNYQRPTTDGEKIHFSITSSSGATNLSVSGQNVASSTIVDNIYSFIIGAKADNPNPSWFSSGETILFKVHDDLIKAPTDLELYEDAVAKGLLS